MRGALVLLFGGFALSALGMATATDAISLREVCHAVPVLGGLVTDLRLGMGTSMAHAVEPASGVLGLGVMLLALRTSRARAARALAPVPARA
jgi:hypothetical protein